MAKQNSGKPKASGPAAKIVVSRKGPYVVTGQVPIQIQSITPNKEKFSWDWTPGKSFPTDAPPPAFDFDALPGFTGGVFVG